jgi:hypothetical protein
VAQLAIATPLPGQPAQVIRQASPTPQGLRPIFGQQQQGTQAKVKTIQPNGEDRGMAMQ